MGTLPQLEGKMESLTSRDAIVSAEEVIFIWLNAAES